MLCEYTIIIDTTRKWQVKKMKTSTKDRTIFDQKCITCGEWMETTKENSKKGAVITTYSCPQCGLSYSVGED